MGLGNHHSCTVITVLGEAIDPYHLRVDDHLRAVLNQIPTGILHTRGYFLLQRSGRFLTWIKFQPV